MALSEALSWHFSEATDQQNLRPDSESQLEIEIGIFHIWVKRITT
jgi:hypothetical protein